MILVKNLSSQNAVVQTQEVGSRLPNLIPSNEVSGSANKKCLPMTVVPRGEIRKDISCEGCAVFRGCSVFIPARDDRFFILTADSCYFTSL